MFYKRFTTMKKTPNVQLRKIYCST